MADAEEDIILDLASDELDLLILENLVDRLRGGIVVLQGRQHQDLDLIKDMRRVTRNLNAYTRKVEAL